MVEPSAHRSTSGHRVQRWFEKNITNPPVRVALSLGVAPRAFALLETTGRRTGKRRRTPVGNELEGDVFWLVSSNGERASYVRNLLAHPRVRVKVKRRWRTGTATLVPGDDGLARRRRLDRANGLVGRFDGIIFRATANTTEPVTVRIDLEVEGV